MLYLQQSPPCDTYNTEPESVEWLSARDVIFNLDSCRKANEWTTLYLLEIPIPPALILTTQNQEYLIKGGQKHVRPGSAAVNARYAKLTAPAIKISILQCTN